MKHSKRMVVITEEEYRKLKGRGKHKKSVIEYKKKISSQIQKQLMQNQKQPSIESYFDPKYQNQVRALMSELKALGVGVNSKNELQLAHGDTIANSNIINLLRELLVGATTSKDRLPGWNEFLNAIANTEVPLSIFPKNAVKSALRKIRWEEY